MLQIGILYGTVLFVLGVGHVSGAPRQFSIEKQKLISRHRRNLLGDVELLQGRHKRCTSVECDPTGALSSCTEMNQACHEHHEPVPSGDATCQLKNKRCCRIACSGHNSYCFPVDKSCLPGHARVAGTCNANGYSCCAPSNILQSVTGSTYVR